MYLTKQSTNMNQIDSLPIEFQPLFKRYTAIYLIMSPPRCSSTALARVFWEHPSIHYYNHEPFEEAYYRKASLSHVAKKLMNPLDLNSLMNKGDDQQQLSDLNASHSAMVIKEMPYQVGQHFPLLASLATKPILFLIRDPRLNIASRIRKKLEVGDNYNFPWVETGWDLLKKQIDYCHAQRIPHMLIDASDFRNYPMKVLIQVFMQFNLTLDASMIMWRAYPEIDLDNLGGAHSHLYRRVLSSTGIETATEPIPDLSTFPTTNGCREHVRGCLDIYNTLRESPMCIQPIV